MIGEKLGNYRVERMTREQAGQILALYQSNPQYFAAMHSEAAMEGVLTDLTMLPDGKNADSKHYVGLYDSDALVAVLDLIDGYPRKETAFIGLFMVDAAYQGRGVGSSIISSLLDALKGRYDEVRLGFVETNPQSKAFWKKNGFEPTGVRSAREGYTVVIASRNP